VKNILANELKLDRETVENIIRERVEKLLHDQKIENLIHETVLRVITKMLKTDYYDTTTVRSLVRDTIEEFVGNNLEISITSKN